MRRFLWLLVGLILAGYGFDLIAQADAFVPYIVRDGLLAALAGGLIFAWHSAALPMISMRRRTWPTTGRMALIISAACSMAAAGVLALLGDQGWPAWFGGSLWIIALGLWAAALIWPGPEDYAPPAYRWTRDAVGRMVRLALEGNAGAADVPPGRSRGWTLALLLILAGGWALRLWRLAALPPDCLDVECAQALRLVEGRWWAGLDAPSASLYALAAAAIYRLSGDALLALRASAAFWGCVTLPIFYWAGRAYVRPAGALLGLALLAFSPWHLWASRMGEGWIAAPLLLLVVQGAAARALQSGDLRWAGLAGGALGLLLAQPLALPVPTLIYLALVTALLGWAMRRDDDKVAWPVVWITLGSALAVGLPLAISAWRGAMDEAASAAGSVWAALLHGGGAPLAIFLDAPLLPPLVAAPSLAGLVTLARRGRRPHALLPLVGLAIYLLAAATGASGARLPGLALLAWLPFLYLAAAVAMDQTVAAFDAAWARLVPLARTVAVGLALVLVILGPEVMTLQRQWRMSSGGQDAVEVAMGRYLASCLSGQGGDDPCAQSAENAPVFYVPPAVLAHPSTRLLLGAQMDERRVRPLDVGRDLLPTLAPAGSLVYLVAMDNQPLIDLLQQLYPGAQVHAEPRDQAGPTLFLVYAISRDEVLAHQGLAGMYRQEDASSGEIRQDGPLAFAWAEQPPLEPPFEVVWEGSLLVPAAGEYSFEIEGVAAHAPDPVVSMQLDGQLVLDTSLGLVGQRQQLAQGYVQVTLHYRTAAAPGDWAIRWQPPAGSAEPIPRAFLYSPPLPNIGLIGTYHAGDSWQGPVLTVRKDLVLGAPVDVPSPYSVAWTGRLAVPRAGETIFAVTANGPVQVTVAGQPVLDYLPPARLGEGPAFSQASLYLEKGWQPIEVRYAPPQGETDLRLIWQPAGSAPMTLLSRYLLPTTAEVATHDVPLPPAPELVDARLGNADFALSTSMEVVQPARTLPPQNLPPLLAEMRHQVGNGCGAGPGQFNLPHGMAMDAAAGHLYVADTGNRRVVALDVESGAVVEIYAADGFQEPVDVALTPDGSLLVLDALAAAIFRLDRATGEAAPLALQTDFYRPRGLGVDASGLIGVADTGGARVALLDATGALVTQFGGPGTYLGDGQPVDVLAADGRFWTLTAENGRLWLLDALGSLPLMPRSSTIEGPHLADLPDGAFFVSSPAGRTVLYIAPSGQPLAQVVHGEGWEIPTGVAVGTAAGRTTLAVVDSAACEVTIWRVVLEP